MTAEQELTDNFDKWLKVWEDGRAHSESSQETRNKIDGLEKTIYDEKEKIIKDLYVKIEDKLSSKVFYVFLSVLVVVLGGIIGMIGGLYSAQHATSTEVSNRLTKIETTLGFVQGDIAAIREVFKNFEVKQP